MSTRMPGEWVSLKTVYSISYRCGHCGLELSSERGWNAPAPHGQGDRIIGALRVCHACRRPTFLEFDIDGDCIGQYPEDPYGENISCTGNATVVDLYNEARRCTQTRAYTATVLCCRKLLMNVAVSKGAQEGQNFSFYVDYLEENGYITRDSRRWVDYIRQVGNERNHEVLEATKKDAENLITFSGMLLKTVYVYPALIQEDDNS